MLRWTVLRRVGVAAMVVAALVYARPPLPVVGCPCDHSDAETLEARVCSLCRTAEEQTAPVYFLKDISRHKPNRYLALPRMHDAELQHTGGLDDRLRAEVWTAAIAEAERLFGARWGLAENAYFFRTQCHAHIHMGPLSPEVDDVGGTLYGSPAEFPALAASEGVWVHPKDGRYCLHRDRDLAEVVLIR